jgi:AbrB family looped-hinge helix DNA binding protein
MAKVTSKLQVTLPKVLADQFHIAPGDEIIWEAAGDVIRVIPARRMPAGGINSRLRLFDQATTRQRERERTGVRAGGGESRGWTREELYGRGRPR